MDQSLQICFPILDILSYSGDIRDRSRKLYKIDRNFACFWPKFCMFLAQFFGGGPKFLDSIYKIEPVFDHVAKFLGDRPRKLDN